VHIAEGRFQKGQVSVRQSRSFALPEGCLAEEDVKDEQLLADAISRFLKEGKFHAKEAIVTVNASHAVIRELDFPRAKPKELDSMVKNEMVQTFHVMSSDMIQYKEIGKAPGEDGEALKRYRVAAIDRDIVEAYYHVLELAGLKAAAMDLNVNAVDKLFAWSDSINEKPYGDEAVMLLDFGQSHTTVYIFSKGQPMFFRHLPIGSGDMDGILRSSAPQQTADIREIKETMNFFEDSEEADQYSVSLQPFFYRLNDEIRKVVAFYHDRTYSGSIGHVYLFGMGSELPGLPDYWTGILNLPVEKLRSVGKSGTAVRVDPAHLNAVAALIRHNK